MSRQSRLRHTARKRRGGAQRVTYRPRAVAYDASITWLRPEEWNVHALRLALAERTAPADVWVLVAETKPANREQPDAGVCCVAHVEQRHGREGMLSASFELMDSLAATMTEKHGTFWLPAGDCVIVNDVDELQSV